jgi:DNA-binding NtrC family response regulator
MHAMTYVQGHILLVDDNREHREALARIFGRHGYLVTAAADGAEALRVLAEADIDLVVTDLRMPRVGGLALLRGIHQNQPGIPVIIITAYGDSISAVEAAGWGAAAFLQKPVRRDQILGVAARALGARGSHASAGVNRETGL